MNYPKISIIIPTFNEEKRIGNCLLSIFTQDYPKEQLEVIVVDNESTDNTLHILKKFPLKIIVNKIKNTPLSKRIAFDKSRGIFYMWFDADMEMSSKDTVKKLIIPLLEDNQLTGSFGYFATKGDESTLTKFFNMDINQRDPVFQFFTPSITETIIEKRKNYDVCLYTKSKIPPHCIGFLRKDLVKETLRLQDNKLMELDILVHLVNMGHQRFAFVPVAIYHYFMPNLKILLKKRLRYISRNYLGQTFERSYKWFNLKNPLDIAKIIIWVIYANLFIPELIRGVYKSIKYKTWIGIYQPVVSLLETDVIICGFVYYYLRFLFKR